MNSHAVTLIALTLIFFAAAADDSNQNPTLSNASISTVLRDISISAGSLSWFEYNPAVEANGGTVNFVSMSAAVFTLARPTDWADGGLLVTLYFSPSPQTLTGTVDWRLFVADADQGRQLPIGGELVASSSPVVVDGNRLYSQSFFVPSLALHRQIWGFILGRGLDETYDDTLKLHSVKVSYLALENSSQRSVYHHAGQFSFKVEPDLDDALLYQGGRGIWWRATPDDDQAAIRLPRPTDWDDTTPMTVRIHFLDTTGEAGVVRWRASQHFESTQLFAGFSTLSDAPSVFSGGAQYRYYSQDFTITNPDNTQPYWGFDFYRGSTLDGHSYDGPLSVLGAELIYQQLPDNDHSSHLIESISASGLTYSQLSTGIQPIPQALSDSGLTFPAGVDTATGFSVSAPPGWDGMSDVLVHLVFFLDDFDAGAIRWRLSVLDLDSGDSMSRAALDLEPTSVPLISGLSYHNILRQTFAIPADELQGEHWQFILRRGSDAVGESYDGDLTLLHVTIDHSQQMTVEAMFSDSFE